MMKLFIPKLGTWLKLTKDWDFRLQSEYRNRTLWALVAKHVPVNIPWQCERVNHVDTFLPAGTLLKVDRIFIRAGSSGYDSVTFRYKDLQPYNDDRKYSGRFWVCLDDANKIECEVL